MENSKKDRENNVAGNLSDEEIDNLIRFKKQQEKRQNAKNLGGKIVRLIQKLFGKRRAPR